jgi:hypothetical protein
VLPQRQHLSVQKATLPLGPSVGARSLVVQGASEPPARQTEPNEGIDKEDVTATKRT